MIVSLEIHLNPTRNGVVPATSGLVDNVRHFHRLAAIFPETAAPPRSVVGFWADRVGESVDLADVEANLVRQATLMIQEACRRVQSQRDADARAAAAVAEAVTAVSAADAPAGPTP